MSTSSVRRRTDREDLIEPMWLKTLTPREMDVLLSLAQGRTDREIAASLRISHVTVRTHMVNIRSKLGVDSRLQAVVYALRHGVLDV